MFLLHALKPARLRVAPVLQGPPLLLEADHLVLRETPQVSVELTHGHGHELVVGEAVLHVEAAGGLAEVRWAVRVVMVVVAVVVQRLVGVWRHGGRAVGVLAVMMVVLAVRVTVRACVPSQVVRVVRDGPCVRVMVLLAVTMMVVMMVRTSVALEALLLQLLLDVRRRGVTVGCGSNQGLHGILRGQTQRLRVDLLMVRAPRHPVEFFQVVLLLRWAEARRGRHRAAGCADGGRGHGALGL